MTKQEKFDLIENSPVNPTLLSIIDNNDLLEAYNINLEEYQDLAITLNTHKCLCELEDQIIRESDKQFLITLDCQITISGAELINYGLGEDLLENVLNKWREDNQELFMTNISNITICDAEIY